MENTYIGQLKNRIRKGEIIIFIARTHALSKQSIIRLIHDIT